MKKQFSYVALVLLSVFAMTVASCGSKEKAEDNNTEKAEDVFEDRTVQVQIFEGMPVKGEDASYFSVSAPDSSNVVTITGTMKEDSYRNNGIVRAEVNVSVLKKYPEKATGFDGYPKMALVILDADKEEVARLEMSKTDMEVLLAELGKDNPGTVTINYKDEVYDTKQYNEIFDKAKYVYIGEAEIDDDTKHQSSSSSTATVAEDNASDTQTSASTTRSSSSSRASSSRDDSDDDSSYDSYADDDDDDDDNGGSKWSKVKNKAKELGSKAKEKALDWKDKAKEKLHEWTED